jgi:ankyrin repeat protein
MARTALHFAVERQHELAANTLLKYGADVTLRDREMKSPADLLTDTAPPSLRNLVSCTPSSALATRCLSI